MTITHRAFFGDGERNFTLTDPIVIELERLTSTGVGNLFLRLTRGDFRLSDLIEIIRLGMIGADTNPEEAARLIETYARNRPIAETLPLAMDILAARWGGDDEEGNADE
ncbi:gene transfer agent family protein [Paracoccus saliphilus]|uniref:Gene transfer agent family protein n=1 Tax=Paracoccus saliphilus TaxID=405559 RepID=A0AA45W7M5_9RHOB|nr:gene transfer agent family protein [Paracoccus saliphilus]WCR04761.1 gene transfer agent family protein [Paracoccus saliphilus]SIT11028.1 Phage tail tube protein, GTA-gp10 [Paracoccus saliphilus]